MTPRTDPARTVPGDPPADLLFVFAGADWRKAAGLAAWRAGAARALVLSVGRFEWRRIAHLGLENDGGLRAWVEETPPPQRHFILILEREGPRERATVRRAAKGRLGTWSEALALATLVAERGARDVVLCTSGYHVPRAVLSARRALRARGLAPVALRALPVPEPPHAPLASGALRRSPRAWLLLLRERLKWIAYAAFVGTRKGAPDRSGTPSPRRGGSPPPRE